MGNAPRIYVRGSYIDIHDNENVYLTVDKDGEVKTHIDEKQIRNSHAAPSGEIPEELCTADAASEAANEASGAGEKPESKAASEARKTEIEAGSKASGKAAEKAGGTTIECPFSEAQQKASGIKVQAAVVLGLMHAMQPLFTQKVDWLSPYSVLLGRGWVDNNLRAWCRLVEDLFGVPLDPRTLSADLRTNGTDYAKWTDADRRIQRRKRLAADFDTRLTQYFERKRAEVLTSLSTSHP